MTTITARHLNAELTTVYGNLTDVALIETIERSDGTHQIVTRYVLTKTQARKLCKDLKPLTRKRKN